MVIDETVYLPCWIVGSFHAPVGIFIRNSRVPCSKRLDSYWRRQCRVYGVVAVQAPSLCGFGVAPECFWQFDRAVGHEGEASRTLTTGICCLHHCSILRGSFITYSGALSHIQVCRSPKLLLNALKLNWVSGTLQLCHSVALMGRERSTPFA
jgi:hypothetical protein